MKATYVRFGLVAVCILVLAASAEAGTWGLAVGVSWPWDEHWRVGPRGSVEYFRNLSPRLAIGGEGAFDVWRPTDDAPGVGAEWKSSGLAGLFEIVPTVRISVSDPEHSAGSLFLQAGCGATIVSSNAKIVAYPVVLNPIGLPIELMESQVAPCVSVGFGGRELSGKVYSGFELEIHALFVDPELIYNLSFSVGVAF
jgi:hypothetical protein